MHNALHSRSLYTDSKLDSRRIVSLAALSVSWSILVFDMKPGRDQCGSQLVGEFNFDIPSLCHVHESRASFFEKSHTSMTIQVGGTIL